MHTNVVEIRGIALNIMQTYLEELGGKLQLDSWYKGQGWQAHLLPIEDYIIGPLRFEQVRLEWSGNDEAVHAVWVPLQQKFMRAGG